MAIVVNDNSFDELLKSAQPVIVDFSATWCGPCKALAPIVEELAAEYQGKAIVAKADVDECSDIAARYHIRSVPTVLFFKGGEPVDKSVGLVSKQTLVDKINALL